MNQFKLHTFILIYSAFTMACNHTEEGNSQDIPPQKYYSEQHRPQFHFSPEEKWMNDPNGMFFYEGEYHLFYQFYPDSTVWGPMHWGHAISKDLVHWEHLPIGLYPDSLGYIFSGSAVVDWENTSGFGENGEPPLVAIFTHHLMEGEKAGRTDFQYQSIAYSNDKGRTWTKFEGNPVIPNLEKIKDFRDPKVIWDKNSEQWIMVFAAYDHIKFWASKDLKEWQHLSDFGKTHGAHGGVWECPDLFPIKIGNSDHSKWVLLVSINPGAPNGGSGTQYFIGDFDGKEFKLDDQFAPFVEDEKAIWLDYGRDNYAGVTWSDIPKEDGRRIFIGWMSNWDYAQIVPTEKWRSAMTVPRELRLIDTPKGLRLVLNPVEELNILRIDSFNLSNADFKQEIELSKFKSESPLFEINLEIENTEDLIVEIELSNEKNEVYRCGYSGKYNHYYSDRTNSGKINFSPKFGQKINYGPRSSDDDMIKIQLLVDLASAELFADNGKTVLTDIFFPNEDYSKLKLYTNHDSKIKAAKVYTLQPIWNQ